MEQQSVAAPFATLIRDRRVAIGMTQEQLAREIGCPQQTIEKIESGKTKRSGYLPEIFSKLGIDLALLTGVPQGKAVRQSPPKFIRNRTFKFYVQEWREFMGVKVDDAAEAAGMDVDEYQAFEHYPINFGLAQIVALAEEFGIRGDQFWFPPPKGKPAPIAHMPIAKKRARK